MKLITRLHAFRRLLFRRHPFIMIKIKPSKMLQPLPSTYCYEAVRKRLDAHSDQVNEVLRALIPPMRAFRRQTLEHPGNTKDLLENAYFGALDALAAYAMVAVQRPRRIIEVGSGYSTMVFRRAIEDEGLNTKIVCIDPHPRADITAFADEVDPRSVLDVDLQLFSTLDRNDFVFIDGSHYVFSGTDVPHVFLNILPNLKSGVIVHFHDIMLPYEYIESFRNRYYNEQYMLAALLLFSDAWEPILPIYYLREKTDIFEGYKGGSFWMRRA